VYIILSYRWLDWLFLLQYLKVITRLSCTWWKWSVRLALLGINWLILLLLVALTRSKKDYFWLIILALSLATQILALILKKAWSAQVSLLIQFLLSFDITIDRRARSVMLFNLEIFIWLIYLILRLCIYWLWLFFLGCNCFSQLKFFVVLQHFLKFSIWHKDLLVIIGLTWQMFWLT
jgi:hypothetical protein